jgi:hypothetical protein
MLVGGGQVGYMGVLWREPDRMQWHFREALAGRTYPPGSVYVEVYAVTGEIVRPKPVPRDQYAHVAGSATPEPIIGSFTVRDEYLTDDERAVAGSATPTEEWLRGMLMDANQNTIDNLRAAFEAVAGSAPPTTCAACGRLHKPCQEGCGCGCGGGWGPRQPAVAGSATPTEHDHAHGGDDG